MAEVVQLAAHRARGLANVAATMPIVLVRRDTGHALMRFEAWEEPWMSIARRLADGGRYGVLDAYDTSTGVWLWCRYPPTEDDSHAED